ncbi:fungal-specific transcription factor domain-containing protein [Talaromyces proteolyticus]|uniref:Fungal-specific transcription factor domain-containing protein n=1 Tax=Talaromyces proteolyticus TaxID=1131652 RepID=A0AAD4PY42_9EURO|nr:fungal-specific transcription factor domain-containing protein [Talaromyces proteolyticus]KAH8694225.1 fungal-specific transcription factor domain-containing protein [Talaromyces proteolyticus]
MLREHFPDDHSDTNAAADVTQNRRQSFESPNTNPSLGSKTADTVLPISGNSQPDNCTPAEGEPRYHGPTSTLFEDGAGDRKGYHSIPSVPNVPPAWVKKGLMAEAACQRHLEIINLHQKMLDFDGVDPDLGMHLLELHWNRQHHAFLITYRPAFMRDMACGGPYFSKLLLNAIYFGASKFSSRPEVRRDPNDVRTAGWLFRQRVRELLGGALDKSDITTIQALLVMASSLFALGDERSAAWLYAGTAFRMIIDLGMHVDGSRLANYRKFSDEDLEIRRRVFWGAFVVDKIQSLYQGRPVSLQEQECNVSITFLDDYEELEHWKPFAYSTTQSYPGSPAYSVSTFTELCKLSLIMNRILNKVYGERSSTRTPSELAEDLKTLHTNLDQWRDYLPTHLNYDPSSSSSSIPPPHVLSLLAMYNVLIILLHRPFVSDGELHSSPSNAINSFLVCATAAKMIVKILRAYDAAFSIQRAPYLISYATYVSATIHVRIAAQRAPGSEAHVCLATCVDVFKKNQETNWAVRRANVIIQNLMKRMHVSIAGEDIDRVCDLQELQVPQSDRSINNNENTRFSRPESIRSSEINRGVNIPAQSSHIVSADLILDTAGNEGADHVASDLDIDAIIQSFIREQQSRPNMHISGSETTTIYQPHTTSTNQWFPSTSFISESLPSIDDQHGGTHVFVRSDSYSAGYLQADGLPSQFSVDDMLFGFNSSAIEGIGWEFDDQ